MRRIEGGARVFIAPEANAGTATLPFLPPSPRPYSMARGETPAPIGRLGEWSAGG